MDIQSLEINLLKASEINENDIILVKIDDQAKSQFNKDQITDLYNKIKQMVKKEISIYFFPKSLSINIIKSHITNIENNKNQIIEEENEDDK